ncbi:hypothetical protein V6255_14080 [Psychromonas arctica]|uniref:Sulfotransferase domain-containing protein n=1 Tax=Psychromonas arctica TaxID=168275 RepID=A0ABU9HFA8_9GAMM
MKIYLHIGTHKTGSTSIQNVLHKNKEVLIKNGFYYPEVIDNHTGQHHLAWMLIGNDFVNAEKYLSTEVSKAIELNCHSIVLSSEEFEFLNSIERISFFNNFGEVEVIIMLRRQDDFLEAEYNQSVKMPTVRYPKDIFHFYIEKNFSSRINYAHLLQNWITVFKDDAIKIVSYDFERKKRTLLPTFFNLLGLTVDDFPVEKNYTANVSLPNNALIYLSRLNKDKNIPTNKHLEAINYLSEKFKGSRDSFLDNELKEILFERYKNMNIKLFHKIDCQLESFYSTEVNQRKLINHYEDFQPDVYSALLKHLDL